MTDNDALRSLRYLLNLSDKGMVAILKLGQGDASVEEMATFLKRDDEEGYVACGQEVLAHFLNGMVIHKRGKDDTRPPQPLELPITNNTILKKVRVAFELRDSDLLELIGKGGLRVTKAELGAFFRRPDHRNYRECGDQFLRNLLRALS